MERIILIFAISVLFGACIIVLVGVVYSFITGLEIEKKFRERSEKITNIYQKGFLWNILFIAGKIGDKTRKIRYKKLEELADDISKQLAILGGPYKEIDAYTFIGVEILIGIAFILVGFAALDITNVILLLATGVAGFFVPLFWIKEQVKAKHKAIFRQIPDVLDMLTLMVEAGLDFNTSLSKILMIEKGVLIDEFQASQQEIKLGKSRLEAFETFQIE